MSHATPSQPDAAHGPRADLGVDHAHHGPQGVGVYVTVAIALVFLTSLSYATHLPVWETLVGDRLGIKWVWMMAVSCTKAMLVIMFFMHLKWEANWKWVLTIPASLMSLFLVLMLVPDVGMRMRKASPERLKYAAEIPAVQAKAASERTHTAEE